MKGSKKNALRIAEYIVANWNRTRYLDFCRDDPNTIINETKKIVKREKRDIPLLFIGHSKDFLYPNHLRQILSGFSKIQGINYSCFRDSIRKYNKRCT